MSEMVDRAAKGICDLYAAYRAPGNSPMPIELARMIAFGVIEELRAPTKEMVLAGETALEDAKDSDWDSGGDGNSHNSRQWVRSGAQTEILQAMIDEALK